MLLFHQLLKLVSLLTLTLTLTAPSLFVHAESNPKSKEFLTYNTAKPNVITLPSGLQYKILRSGSGKFHPTINSPCSCHYKGTLIDGKTQFDSSYDRGSPTTFAPNQVIKGWTEAMQLMVEGDMWELYIPSELAYGDRGSPPKIPGGDALIFTLELLTIQGDSVPAVQCNVETLEDCTEKEMEYVRKVGNKYNGDVDEMEVEMERIERVVVRNTQGSKDNHDWGVTRVRILKQLMKKKGEEEESEL